MLELAHYNDGKEKYQSHEISLKEEYFYNQKYSLFSYNIFDATGYGSTEQEAIEDFKEKFAYLLAEYKAFAKLLESDVLIGSIVEIDCVGKKIK